jgi:glutamine synthetase
MTINAKEILATLHNRGVKFVRFTFTDNAGLIRAKAVHIGVLPEFLDGARVGLTPASQGLPVMYDALAPDSGLSAVGEVHLQADWSTLRVLPFSPGQARVIADIVDGDQPWAFCPRDFLRRMIARAGARGLTVKAAFENEFALLQSRDDGWRTVDPTVFCQTAAMDGAGDVICAIADALVDQGVIVEQAYPESAPGQFEMPVRYTHAMGAADQQVVFRETVKAVAKRHGLIGSFLPKIMVNAAGSGAHIHFSLWDGDRNLIPDAQRPAEVSAIGRQFMAGILRHLPALMTITTPTNNSFKRIRPRFWSGAYTCWGYGNKEAPLRVPPGATHGSPITNIELKTSDPSNNPYLALGALIAAGLDGIDRGLDAGEALQMDPADLSEQEQRDRDIRALPQSLGEGISELERDGYLAEAMGAELFQSFVAVRRCEWLALKDTAHEAEVDMLLERY